MKWNVEYINIRVDEKENYIGIIIKLDNGIIEKHYRYLESNTYRKIIDSVRDIFGRTELHNYIPSKDEVEKVLNLINYLDKE